MLVQIELSRLSLGFGGDAKREEQDGEELINREANKKNIHIQRHTVQSNTQITEAINLKNNQ